MWLCPRYREAGLSTGYPTVSILVLKKRAETPGSSIERQAAGPLPPLDPPTKASQLQLYLSPLHATLSSRPHGVHVPPADVSSR